MGIAIMCCDFQSIVRNGVERSVTLAPYKLQLELTYHCNLNCLFCCAPWHDHPELIGTELSTEEWKALIERYLNDNIKLITLTGGEPLLRNDFVDLATFVSSLPFAHQSCLYSNLLLLDAKHERVLVDGRYVINTSLQGVQRWGEMTGSRDDQGALAVWKRNCTRLHSQALPVITTIPVTKLTTPEIKDMIDFAFDAGSDIVQIGPMMIEGRARNHPKLWLSFQEVQFVEHQIEELIATYGDRLRPRHEFFCECRADKVLPANMPKDMKLGDCTAAEEFIIIGPDGRRRKCMHTWEVVS